MRVVVSLRLLVPMRSLHHRLPRRAQFTHLSCPLPNGTRGTGPPDEPAEPTPPTVPPTVPLTVPPDGHRPDRPHLRPPHPVTPGLEHRYDAPP